jgi:diaminohydroxyphosphoribosylaminopyrimidine deaminase/5-amino-6-(5-phosphoribosylamino)uracil reductase
MRVDADAEGRVSLPDALALLGVRGLTRLFCEGGPALANALARADLVDEIALITGESVAGTGDVPAVGPHLSDRLREFRARGEEQVGSDRFSYFERP